uniref:NAC domain-containing protein n=1 Tax=Kalanchoe fedtschenkoi TaxID=63787 RepID=A0A7N0U891_KALFE
MGLKDIGATLPPGFRFNPSDEELICHYLYKKIANEEVLKGTLMEIDLHTCEPWQLPEMAKLNASEWYFFSFRDRKYATGYRTNRATTCGYWKATGKDRTVHDPITFEVVGMRKTLVFYLNRAPNGIKSGWIMHEFRLESPHTPPKEDWVLCRVFYKSKQGENTNTTSPISPPPNTFQNNLHKPAIPSSSPPNNTTNNNTISITPQNNNTFHKQSTILHCEYQPQIMSLNPNSIVHHLVLEPDQMADATPISIGALACSGDHADDDCLRFLWELKEDDNNDMDIISTLDDQMGFEVDGNSMVLFP